VSLNSLSFMGKMSCLIFDSCDGITLGAEKSFVSPNSLSFMGKMSYLIFDSCDGIKLGAEKSFVSPICALIGAPASGLQVVPF
jgi:hypothetical protein